MNLESKFSSVRVDRLMRWSTRFVSERRARGLMENVLVLFMILLAATSGIDKVAGALSGVIADCGVKLGYYVSR